MLSAAKHIFLAAEKNFLAAEKKFLAAENKTLAAENSKERVVPQIFGAESIQKAKKDLNYAMGMKLLF